MRFKNASQLPLEPPAQTDVCIVGSGAAGLTLARELAGSSRRVLLLEAGERRHDAATEADAFRVEDIGEPRRSPLPDRARRFGGSTTAWFGRVAAPDEIEFEERTWVCRTGWPFGREELSPWLIRGMELLEVPHAARLARETWVTHPTARFLSQDDDADYRVFLWAGGKDMGAKADAILAASRNIEVILGATALELVPYPGTSRIAEVIFCGQDGRTRSVKANDFILASGGIENPRLLLASNSLWKAGVGNEYDQVGRNYMDHPRDESSARVNLKGLSPQAVRQLGLLRERACSDAGPAQLRLVFAAETQRKEGLLNHALHGHFGFEDDDADGVMAVRRVLAQLRADRFDRGATVRDARIIARDAVKIAKVSFSKLRNNRRPDRLVVVDQMEQRPDPNSRITLNWKEKDQFGLPRVRLDWRISEDTYLAQRRMHALFQELLSLSGIPGFSSDVLANPEHRPALLDMKHPMGTTRMSNSPSDGVVDANCKVHGVDNLFVAGSSVFPVGGHANPTLLIVALAARLADHLKKNRTSM